MKLSESLMTVLITTLGILPFIWFTYIGRKAFLKSKKEINDLLKSQGMKFGQSEIWNRNFIGIEDATNKLLYVKLKTPENEIIKIDLNDVKSVHINKITRDYQKDKKTEQELQSINLELTFASHSPKVSLNLYDINDGLSEDYEMKRAEKWQELINTKSAKNRVASAAA